MKLTTHQLAELLLSKPDVKFGIGLTSHCGGDYWWSVTTAVELVQKEGYTYITESCDFDEEGENIEYED